MSLVALIRKMKPLWLREKLFWHLGAWRSKLDPEFFESARLEFIPGVRLTLKPSDIGHRQIAVLGYMERDLTVLMNSIASRGGLLVDVGANYGYFTSLWAAAGKANRVVAFEASPRNMAGLKRNVEQNGLQSQVTILPKAAGKVAGTMHFYLGPEDQTGWGGLSATQGKDDIEVEVTSLDDHCSQNGISEINVLKIDTEGADTWVIEGAARLLREKRIQHVFFEENPSRMEKLGIRLDEAPALLRAEGYRVEKMGKTEWHAYL